ncbi:MAG: sigma-70 family RNA polymerase sigma factor [Lachnospiraceae bacterium]|nr:sigma-70 family RNA polymerase sigma factor [Lachnospiraceae bacterium]
MTEFEMLLGQVKKSVEYFVKCKVSPLEDAQDVLQESYLTAYQRFDQLKDRNAFKAWILSIARNKCNDYFRRKAAVLEIPLETAEEYSADDGRMGIAEVLAVRDHLERMADKDKEILYLYFWKQMPQEEIAKRLNVPVGTVKSRLYVAKQKFKESYEGSRRDGKKTLENEALRLRQKRENQESARSRWDRTMEGANMKRLPEYMPKYEITARTEEPFAVKWEELMGWFLVPRLGEELSWGMYDQPSGKCDHVYDMKVTGRAKVHGIEGVELTAREASYSDKKEVIERTFVAQLTDTHCRYLATIRNDNGVRNFITFLDGEEFMQCWGFGEDNCGNETNLAPKGDIKREGNVITTAKKNFLLDIVGRYDVTICGKTYDTVCVMDVQTYNNGVVSEQFLDKNGRTILWRRFNKNDWHVKHYGGKLWSEQLPKNDQLIVDGETYVQWYDCITDYIL